ncbi:spore coat protein U domain-containing protein [Diaphorobacter sp. HDW4A]|uniref:Csu type fimbrial protein n=1 Tax=Diaphorobacter sp. HDW4A TaxID=2714924 RepID=UPI00140A6F90|nr:spore coat U domain-containing protein [Diaphorobacter sp. HDW4A]QIL81964.1 spore coat protein U domain-containing protein [Diaphorobacter sp. HDW4A]
MSFKRFAISAVVASAAVLSMNAAQAAGSVTGTFNVLLTVQGKCQISTAATDIDFGTLDMGATTTVLNNTFSVQCTKGTVYSITLSPKNAGATENSGQMKSAANDIINYTLHTDLAANTAWGKTSAVGGTSSTSSSAPVVFKAYAKVAGNVVPDVPVGAYKDTVTITVTY